jgi:hypothetical protein
MPAPGFHPFLFLSLPSVVSSRASNFSQLQGAYYVATNITWVSSSRLVTAPMSWPFGAAQVLALVKRSPHGPFCSNGGGAYVFTLEEGVTAVNVANTSVWAMDDVSVTFRGGGFSVLSSYTCILVASSGNLSLSTIALDIPLGLAWERNVSADTAAANSTEVVCPPLKWPFPAGEVVAALLRNGSVVSGSLQQPLQVITILQHWTHVTPHQVSAEGAVVTVREFPGSRSVPAGILPHPHPSPPAHLPPPKPTRRHALSCLTTWSRTPTDGFGFGIITLATLSTSYGEYRCLLTQNSSDGVLVYATKASLLDEDKAGRQLACPLSPAGFGGFVAGTRLEVQLEYLTCNDGEKQDASQSACGKRNSTELVPSYPQQVPVGKVGQWRRDVDVMEIVHSISPSSVSATGGILLYLSGHGFASRVSLGPCSYSVIFGRFVCTSKYSSSRRHAFHKTMLLKHGFSLIVLGFFLTVRVCARAI